ncbi:hypothetical protein, partial [Heyndrickxia coagulans]|uniref:hypothetical protein n=1 Tax=Heyndrickxia coagulans TaxID=1398 RepID=UPI001F16CF42
VRPKLSVSLPSLGLLLIQQALIRQFHRVRASFGLMFPIDPPAPRGHLFILRFYLPNSVYLFTPDLPKNLAFCVL